MNCSRSLALLVAVLLCAGSGCAEEEEDGTPSCEVSDEVDANQMVATVDGSNWTAESQGYQLPGAVGFIIAVTRDAHNTMTVRLHHTAVFSVDEQGLIDVDDGDDVADVFWTCTDPSFTDEEDCTAAEETWSPVGPIEPVEFSLGSSSRDGGDVTLTVDDETFHTDDGDGSGGYMYIEPVVEGEGNNPDVARGCFYFDAGTAESDEVVSVVSGSFAANPL